MRYLLASLLLATILLSGCGHVQTQTEMNQAATAEALQADAEMQAVYQHCSPRWTGRAAGELKASQRAWIAYRDAQVHFEGGEVRGGTMEPLIRATTQTALTRERSHLLRDRL